MVINHLLTGMILQVGVGESDFSFCKMRDCILPLVLQINMVDYEKPYGPTKKIEMDRLFFVPKWGMP